MQTWIEECFKRANASFLVILKDNEIHDFTDCQSVLDIYAISTEIQMLQATHEELCALGRINSYIKKVHELMEVIETITCIRKDRLLLIWVRRSSRIFQRSFNGVWPLILNPFKNTFKVLLQVKQTTMSSKNLAEPML